MKGNAEHVGEFFEGGGCAQRPVPVAADQVAVVRHYPSTDAVIVALSNQAVRPSRRPAAHAAAANSLRVLTSNTDGQTSR